MKGTPEISVIMSVYNGADYLAEAMESICRQTFADWELIVINDCSTDGTADILRKYAEADSRIRVYTNEVNLKLPSSLNKALSLARGKYTARMDADDICLPDRLEKQYAFMEANPQVMLSSCRFFTLYGGDVQSGGCGGKCDAQSLKALLLLTNPLLHPGVIARSEAIRKLGYDVSLTCTEDLELWTRFSREQLKMEILDEYLMLYRIHDKQITSTTLDRQHKEVLKIQKVYIKEMLAEMTDAQADFYINGIYFREQMDIDRFCEFYRWMKQVNREKKNFVPEALDYAMFEILAEYKRRGISKAKLLKAFICFPWLFVIRELSARKRRAKEDGERCIRAAAQIGLVQTGGTQEFPVFSRYEGRS